MEDGEKDPSKRSLVSAAMQDALDRQRAYAEWERQVRERWDRNLYDLNRQAKERLDRNLYDLILRREKERLKIVRVPREAETVANPVVMYDPVLRPDRRRPRDRGAD